MGGGVGEDEPRPGVPRQHPQSLVDGVPPAGPGAPGRVGRHRHDPRVETAEKGGDELQAGRIEQQGALAEDAAGALEPGGERAGASVELAEAPALRFYLTVTQESECRPVGMLGDPLPDNLDNRES